MRLHVEESGPELTRAAPGGQEHVGSLSPVPQTRRILRIKKFKEIIPYTQRFVVSPERW